jgi:ligand-binding sensor domain-containing protein
MIEDKNGHFWFSNTRYRYKITSKSASDSMPYQKEKGLEIATSKEVEKCIYFMSIIENDQGNLWLTTYDDGVWCKRGDELIHYPIKDGDTDVLLFSMYKDTKGHLWFGTSSLGACRFDGKSIQWFYEKHWSEIPNGGSFGIRAIIEDKNGHFWFSNTSYRYKITSENTLDSMPYQKEKGLEIATSKEVEKCIYFMSIVENDQGDLWMTTYDDGVWCKTRDKLIHYPIKDGDTDVLLFSMYKDKQGGLWLTTHNAGVYKYNGVDFKKFNP